MSMQRLQFQKGARAQHSRTGVLLSALGLDGGELDVYVEKQYPVCRSCQGKFDVDPVKPIPPHYDTTGSAFCEGSNVLGTMPPADPKFFCPSCGNAFLVPGEISGPNSIRRYRCASNDCLASFVQRDNMPKGIILEIA
tara:strand:- start:414 stop:827 length:414 start_codon:yes stop_codon:yes gene_type:complete